MRSKEKKIEEKNKLENYCFSLRNSLNEEKIAAQLGADKAVLEKKIQETMTWLEQHPDEPAPETYDEKYKDLEKVANPIMMKAYGGGGAPGGAPGGMPGGMPPGAGGAGGPHVEEVD